MSLQTDQLAVTGGASPGDCARRIAKKIIGRHLAKRMNFCGKSPKMGLKHTTILEIIKGMTIAQVNRE